MFADRDVQVFRSWNCTCFGVYAFEKYLSQRFKARQYFAGFKFSCKDLWFWRSENNGRTRLKKNWWIFIRLWEAANRREKKWWRSRRFISISLCRGRRIWRWQLIRQRLNVPRYIKITITWQWKWGGSIRWNVSRWRESQAISISRKGWLKTTKWNICRNRSLGFPWNAQWLNRCPIQWSVVPRSDNISNSCRWGSLEEI